MTFETKDFTGALFRNDKREKDSQPHAKGDCVIDGVAYWVSAWTNTSKNGQRYQSLKFTAKEEVQNKGMQDARAAITGDMPQDDIPF